MSDDELYLLKMTAFHANNPCDRARALVDYANLLPNDSEWRDFLLSEMRTSAVYSYLCQITGFPNEGVFAAEEVLGLTDHGDYYTRSTSLLTIARWFSKLNFRPSDPKAWSKVLERRLKEPSPPHLGTESNREYAIRLLEVLFKCIHPNRKYKRPRTD